MDDNFKEKTQLEDKKMFEHEYSMLINSHGDYHSLYFGSDSIEDLMEQISEYCMANRIFEFVSLDTFFDECDGEYVSLTKGTGIIPEISFKIKLPQNQ